MAEDAEYDKENKENGVNAEFDAAFVFPNEFPYEFDSFGTEPVESGSTGTESSDEEDFFAGLTRRLSHAALNETRKQLTVPICNSDKTETQKKTRGLAVSPQSTLSGWSCRSVGSGDGSPNGSSRVPSPTTTPFNATNEAWDVLYAAAGQVARMKMNGEASSKFEFNNRGLLGGLPPPIAVENALFSNQGLSQVRYQHVRQQEQVLRQQCGSVWGRQVKGNCSTQQHQPPQPQNRVRDFGYDYEGVKCTRPVPHSAWHPLQVKHQNQQVPHFGSGSRPGLLAGSGVKRGCAGTGVFLPRQYGAPPPESRKKTSCAAPVLVPAKVIHALNLNIDDINAATTQPRFSSGFGLNYDALLARRNSLLLQQKLCMRLEEAANYEIRLPQEWTY
ncbi:uncharacterized protein LOC113847816 [Abrus precatorius]|uniref:Uncharacterized protein LOC113847816 n=1 Tax=Abrus precatorius TaxID=3816 RepID=A0A8B8JN83_ABRPR|nr:uncharacterized protein LOC113847816 [Abrus precatorius]